MTKATPTTDEVPKPYSRSTRLGAEVVFTADKVVAKAAFTADGGVAEAK